MRAKVIKTGRIIKDVVGFEGLYVVSSYGDVYSKERKVWNGKTYYIKKGRKLKQALCKNGYKYVVLAKNGKNRTFSVHELVANAFLENPNKYPCVNHIDENKLNNNYENLEFCTTEYNNNYGTKKERISKALLNNEKTSKCVVSYDSFGIQKHYISIREAYRQTGINSSHISECCNGKRKSAGGLKWEFADGLIEELKKEKK